MPSFKLKGAKAQEVKTGFEAYDGPTPTRKGFYRAVIKKLSYGKNSKGSTGFNLVVELEAAPGDPKGHGMFDGYPLFIRSIITETASGDPLKEGSQRNLDNFLAALGTGDEPNVVLEDGDLDDGVAVKKIGSRNPIGAAVNIDLGFEDYQGEPRPASNGVYKLKDEAPGAAKGKVSASDLADDEEDLLDEEEIEEESDEAEDDELAERQTELEGMKIAALKTIAKGLSVGISGTKEALIERILDAEFSVLDGVDDEEESEEEESEDEVEETEDEEEEEEEEEVDEARAEREEELGNFDRTALKKIVKEVAPDFTVLKRHSDDELRDAILEVEFGDELPF